MTGRGWVKYKNEEKVENDNDDEDSQILSTDIPSPQTEKWNFRWREQETGESEIHLYSEERLCSMTFSSSGDFKVTGTFHNEYVSDCAFSEVKVNSETGSGRCDIRRA